MSVIFVFTLTLGVKQFKRHQKKIEKLEKEILDLDEYEK